MEEAMCQRQAAAELGALRTWVNGPLLPTLAVLKGRPNAAELAGAPVCSGEDGSALGKAMMALGYSPADAPCFVATWGMNSAELRLCLEVLDPQIIVAVDAPAREGLSTAFEFDFAAKPGAQEFQGRRFVYVEEFEACLGEQELKRRAWAQLKAVGMA